MADSCPVACGSNIQITLNSQGNATIIPALVLTNYDPTCTDDIGVEVFSVDGTSLGNTVSCTEIGQTLQVEITNYDISSSCTGTISVVDNLSPTIECTTQYISCGVISYAPGFVPYPTVYDNCTPLTTSDLSYSDNTFDLNCLTDVDGHLVTGKIERTWTVEDEQGNVESCIQNIYIERVNISDIDFPQNMDDVQLPALDCNQDDPYNLNVTGFPSVNGIPLDPEGDCEFVITHNDQVAGLCSPNVFKVIRTWQIVDYCTDEFAINAQVIKVLDKIAPNVTCPNDMVVSANSTSCGATIVLPNANVWDNCSSTSQSISWSYGTGTGPFFNVPLGIYTIDYLITDDCGNESTCSMQLTVIDNVNPTPICHMATNVGLQANGAATINSATFDDGSSDNCGIAYFQVSRDDFFGDSLVFTCEDIEMSPIDVVVRVYDIHGLYSDVSVVVHVEDNVYPTISAPNNTSMTCDADFTNLALTGQPTYNDNCGVSDFYYTDNISLSCGVGTVTRTWYVEDLYGHTASDVQTITIYDNTPVQVSFPTNVDLYTCGVTTEPSSTGMPVVSGDNCEQVAVDYSDIFFDISAPACYKIYRTWSVINDCVYNPNNPNSPGIWEHTQTISVFDTVAPILTPPSNLFIDIFVDDCEIYVNVPMPTVADCSDNITIINDSPYADSATNDASGVYPTGTYVVKYYVEDGCGNMTNCSMLVVVDDAKPPTPVCNFAISISLENDGTVFLTPELINNNSWDNCTPVEDLIITISPNFLTCEDEGEVEVTMTVEDNEGNTSFCTTTVYVQDNLNVCGTNISYYDIQGGLNSYTNAPMANVDVDLEFDNLMQTTSGTLGDFMFEDLVSTQSYTLRPYKDNEWRNGVNSYDLIKIGRHVLETEYFDSPYKYIAADVNNSESITGADVVILRQLILFNVDTLPNIKSWRFIDEDFVFPFGQNPLAADYNQEIIIHDISNNMSNLNFVTVKTGDVTGDAVPTLNGGLETRSERPNHILNVKNQSYDKDEEIWVEFSLDNNKCLTAQGTMSFDINELDILGVFNVNKIAISEFFGLRFALDGYVTFSVNLKDNPSHNQFLVKCKSKKKGSLENALSISNKYTPSISYDPSGDDYNLEIQFEDDLITTNTNKLLTYPNPFLDNVYVALDIKDNQQMNTIEVYNTIGQQVYNINTTQNDLNINTSHWQNGLYLLIHKVNNEIQYSTQIVKAE